MDYYAKAECRYHIPSEYVTGAFGVREFQRYRRFGDDSEIEGRGESRRAVIWFQTSQRFNTFAQYLANCKALRGEDYPFIVEYNVHRTRFTLRCY